jgi:hypothetical protein
MGTIEQQSVKFVAGDRIEHIFFGISTVVNRKNCIYSKVPDEYLYIRPDVLPKDTDTARYAEIQLVEEDSCLRV